MPGSDPLTQIYDALWDMLETHKGFDRLVRVGNRAKFSLAGPRDPVKDEISEADLPEVRIVRTGGEAHLQRTSNGSSILQRYEVQIGTKSLRYDTELFPLEWEIYKAFSKWQDKLKGLEWAGKPYVKLARPLSFTTGVDEGQLDRGIEGWATVWSIEVELWFATADLQQA